MALKMIRAGVLADVLDALERRTSVDVFVVDTDSETWHRDIHPIQAIHRYRERVGIAAKPIVVGMVSSGFSIADPNDAGMMNVVGFDTAVPHLMGFFAEGGESGCPEGTSTAR